MVDKWLFSMYNLVARKLSDVANKSADLCNNS